MSDANSEALAASPHREALPDMEVSDLAVHSPISPSPQPHVKAPRLDRTRWGSRQARSDSKWAFLVSPDDRVNQIYAEQLSNAFATLGVPTGSPQDSDGTEVQLCLDCVPTKIKLPSILGLWDAMRSPLRVETIVSMRAAFSGIAVANSYSAKILIDSDLGLPVANVGVGIDHVQSRAAGHPVQEPARRFRFLHVSEGESTSGIDLLVAAFRYMFGEDDDVSLLLGVPAERASDLVRCLAIRPVDGSDRQAITVKGIPSTGTEVERLYEDADVFITACRRSCDILPIQRAVAFGLPVIATGWGSHRDIADETNGWAIDFDYLSATDPEREHEVKPRFSSIIDRIATAFTVEPHVLKDLGAAGLARIGPNHLWTAVARRLLSFGERNLANASAGKPVIGWLTTWNKKCGIANASASMIAATPDHGVLVFGPREPAIRSDESFCLRSWNIGKAPNDLDNILAEIQRRSVRAIIIQFNYGFYNHAELSAFIETCADRYIAVVVEFHSTVDPQGEAVENWCIAEFAPALRRCDRVLVHEVSDMARMKALGVVHNVTLFPLGVIKGKPRAMREASRKNTAPLLASYGFCLPNKGLPELAEAVGYLKDMGSPVRLRMVNALHPDPISKLELLKIKNILHAKGLQRFVEIVSDYLTDEESLQLLAEADLIVNPYQRTLESASASVRHGLSSGTPVAVTPLPIFNDLRGAVFQMTGVSPKEMAEDIRAILDEIERGSEKAITVAQTARRWVDEHNYNVVGKRLWSLTARLVQQPLASRL